MAFDPLQEDCLRLILSSMKHDRIPLSDSAYVQRAANAFRADPASLIHTDTDRSFHLVAKATELIDFRSLWVTDDAEADHIAEQAENYLNEAAELDPGNWDAVRMLAAMGAPTNDAYVNYLLDNLDAVERDMAAVRVRTADPYDAEFARDLGQRPYLRWLAAISSRALISGRYRLSRKYAEKSLGLAPLDPVGVRHTAMLALAKLEADPAELKDFRARYATAYQQTIPQHQRRRRYADERDAQPTDAWSLIAEMNAAYRALDFVGATCALRAIIRIYPHAAETLFTQAEFPDGVFGRVDTEPGSADELILALSEATPLLQEGAGAPDDASFSQWVAGHELVQSGFDAQAEFQRIQQANRDGDN